MKHPRKWDERTVTIKIYPHQNGFQSSYIVCFEPCDSEYAESSPFVVYTAIDRFKGYVGDRPVVIRARYSSSCFYKSFVPCVHHRFGRFYEIPLS